MMTPALISLIADATEPSSTSLPVAIGVALIIVERVVHYIKELRGGKPEVELPEATVHRIVKLEESQASTYQLVREVKAVAEKTQILAEKAYPLQVDLHRWHDKEDGEGVKVWYVRKSLEDAINKLAECIAQQTQLFKMMHEELRDMHREMEAMQKNHDDCPANCPVRRPPE